MNRVKILVVEDDVLVRDQIVDILEQAGYEIAGSVSSGAEAITNFQRQPSDIVIMDYHLKGALNGVETIRELQKSADFRLVYVTSDLSDAVFEAAKATKPNQFLEKPIYERTVLRAVDLSLSQDLVLKNPPDFVFYPQGQHHIKLVIKDILYMSAEGSRTVVFSEMQGDIQRVSISISSNHVFEQMRSPFIIRIHKSHYVNINKVQRTENKNLLYVGNIRLPVSKTYQEAVLAALPFLQRPG